MQPAYTPAPGRPHPPLCSSTQSFSYQLTGLSLRGPTCLPTMHTLETSFLHRVLHTHHVAGADFTTSLLVQVHPGEQRKGEERFRGSRGRRPGDRSPQPHLCPPPSSCIPLWI